MIAPEQNGQRRGYQPLPAIRSSARAGLERMAEDTVRAYYEPLKADVLRSVAGKLRGAGAMGMGPHDLDDAYNQGWQGVYEHVLQGKPLVLPGLLFTITYRRALDIYRTKHGDRWADVDLDSQSVEVDLARALDDQQKLRRLFSRLKERLNETEREAVALCVLRGYPRAEAADQLRVDRSAFERIMDGAMKKISTVVASIEARGCGDDEWARLMRSYAFGVLAEDDRDYERAYAHVEAPEGCESCRRYVRALQGLSAILPPILPEPSAKPGHLLRLFKANARATAATRDRVLALKGSAVKIAAVAGVALTLSFAGFQLATPAHRPAHTSVSHARASAPTPSPLTASRGLGVGVDWQPRLAAAKLLAKRLTPRRRSTRHREPITSPEFTFETTGPALAEQSDAVVGNATPLAKVSSGMARRVPAPERPSSEFPGFEG